MLRLTAQDLRINERYEQAKPRKQGTLHECMKYLIDLAEKHEEDVPDVILEAICDLELEARFHEAEWPPFRVRKPYFDRAQKRSRST